MPQLAWASCFGIGTLLSNATVIQPLGGLFHEVSCTPSV